MQQAVLSEQDPDRVRALVQQGFDINDPVGCGTFSALDGAVSKENPQLVRLLLSLGAKPLMIAVEKGYAEIFDLLVAAGARPEARNDEGLNAIDVAERTVASETELREKMLRRLKPTVAAH